MVEIKTDGKGKVLVSNDILAVIASKSTKEVGGVIGLTPFGRNRKGVAIQTAEDGVKLAVAINVKMGSKLSDIAKAVQNNVKTDIETMTGLTMHEVNVRISTIAVEKPKGNKTK